MSSTPDERVYVPRKTREQRLAALAEAHYQWSLRQESTSQDPAVEEGAAVNPDAAPEQPWVPLVTADPVAEDEFLTEAQAILGR